MDIALYEDESLKPSATGGRRMTRRLLRKLSALYRRPVVPGKPRGVHLSDRLWRRQSALYMCLQDERAGRST